MTGAPLQVVTVCTANICRSPFAQLLLAERLGPGASVSSGGTRALTGSSMDHRSAEALADRGLIDVAVDGFRASALTTRRLEAADLILTATTEHRDQAIRLAPRALKRAFTLLEFADLSERVEADSAIDLVAACARARVQASGNLDIVDPVGLGSTEYGAVLASIEVAVERISARLGQLLDPPTPHAPAPDGPDS